MAENRHMHPDQDQDQDRVNPAHPQVSAQPPQTSPGNPSDVVRTGPANVPLNTGMHIVQRLRERLGAESVREARRNVTRRGSGVRGEFPSAKFRRRMPWQSKAERQAVFRLELSHTVVDACMQPASLRIPTLDDPALDGLHQSRGGNRSRSWWFRLHARCALHRRARRHALRGVQGRAA